MRRRWVSVFFHRLYFSLSVLVKLVSRAGLFEIARILVRIFAALVACKYGACIKCTYSYQELLRDSILKYKYLFNDLNKIHNVCHYFNDVHIFIPRLANILGNVGEHNEIPPRTHKFKF